MQTWKTDLVTIEEIAFDHNLHAFDVYNHAGVKIGTINPDTIEDMESIKKELDNGACPIADKWEDGNGNDCNLNGWGIHEGN